MKANRSNTTALIIGIVVLLCCLCVLVAGMVGYAYFLLVPATSEITETPFFPSVPTTPHVETEVAPLPVDLEPVPAGTLELLQNTGIPINDPWELACRLKSLCGIPRVMTEFAAPRAVGQTKNFWVHNLDRNENNQIQATLRYITPSVYFWVQDGVRVNERAMKALVDEFEYKIYPTTREFFGSEASPGIDGDERIYILYARGLGISVLGYFSSSDAVHPLIKPYSNGHEMFLFNADLITLDNPLTASVLAHEFQHMIHQNLDANETTWLNEGASELAAFINGYGGGFEYRYIGNTDTQLNDWNPEDSGPHYGAAFLFMTYFLDRFGETATQALVRHPANGLESVDLVLEELGTTDPLTGQRITADSFFMDWAVTNLLMDASVGDGRFFYANFPGAPKAPPTETVYRCPQSPASRSVKQYGVHYISIECSGDYTITFDGSTATKLLPAYPYSGDFAFWSNKGDESNMTLTREFDFTQVSAPIEFSFRAWYDIETDWDYLYLEVSEDGEVWDILLTPSGTGTNPSGNSYGWGYTGASNGWIEEKIDLSEYAGKNIFIRFEYITDAAVHGEGFLLDDVRVDAAGYWSDFEADDGGWVADGFARVQNVLPQTFGLALILTGDASVTMIPLDDNQMAEIPISLKAGERAYLVITGTTRFTRIPAMYQILIR
jgi:immune inhibitor A